MTLRPDEPRASRLPLIVVILAPAVAFAPILFNSFTTWDDPHTITENARLTLSNLGYYWHPKHNVAGLYVPMTYTIWIALAATSRAIHGALVAWPFHAASLAFHLLAVACVYLILRRLIGSPRGWPECVGALVFALHPMQVEAVAWTSGLKDVGAAALALVALHQHVRGGRLSRAVAPLAFACGMLFKPSAGSAIAIAIVIDVLILKRRTARDGLALLPWIVIAVPLLAIARHAQETQGIPTIQVPQRLLVASDAIAFYVFKLVAPLNLALDYGRKPDVVLGAGGAAHVTWIVPVSVAIVLLIARSRWLTAAALVFVAGLSLNLGLQPFQFQFYSTVADHYAYLAMLGLAMAAAWLASRKPAITTYTICGVILAACAVLVVLQTRVWRNSIALFQRAVDVNPDSAGAHNNLGSALGAAGDLDQAQEHLLEAIRLAPYDPLAHRSMALLRLKKDDLEGAIRYLAESIRLNELAGQDVSGDRRELARLLSLRTQAKPPQP